MRCMYSCNAPPKGHTIGNPQKQAILYWKPGKVVKWVELKSRAPIELPKGQLMRAPERRDFSVAMN